MSENKNKKLEVNNLKISFRTVNGKVQAVRNINFDLYENDTLAIVGESGSGKSVTSKAILGISAANAIIESGEIIYDGKDLLTIPEEEFHKIRGDKIAMIFQDPLSSLNPIMKIGRQLTEAMLLKGKVRQRESRALFNSYLNLLKKNMISALAEGDSVKAQEIAKKCYNFNKFELKHLELERSYNFAHEAAVEASEDIEILSFELEKNAAKDIIYRTKKIIKNSLGSIEKYVVSDRSEELSNLVSTLLDFAHKNKKNHNEKEDFINNLSKINEILKEALAFDEPNFFSLGYYLTFANEPLPQLSVKELTVFLRKYLDDNFMLDFIKDAKEGLIYSSKKAYEKKEEFVNNVDSYKQLFSVEDFEKSSAYKNYKYVSNIVNDSIDRLEIHKDNIAYTFGSSLKKLVDNYFASKVKNVKEQKRFNKQTSKFNALVNKGKKTDWKVAPLSLTDLNGIKESIIHLIDRLVENYKNQLAIKDDRNFDNETVDVIDFLKATASSVVEKVTKGIAKSRAIKLMEEVGISEPRRRYNQYPFEFSGGMRQRIVIAIALAANPDILICDEPTTALDVTIQAQILELINELKAKRKLAVIFITHDLGVVANMADRIAVMYAGKIVEYGTAYEIFYKPAHPYTWALLSSMPDLDTNEKLEAIPGTPPNMIYPPVGDAFADRNKYALKIDFEEQPPMFKITDTHYAATWLLHPNAPKIEVPKIVTDRIKRMEKVNAEALKKMNDENLSKEAE